MTRYVVVADWTATYGNPIRLAAGDRVALTGRRDLWDGHLWLWARSCDGAEGWIPDDLVVEIDGICRARTAYAATELTCRRGEILAGTAETHGWAWCRAADGRCGWVPIRHLAAGPG